MHETHDVSDDSCMRLDSFMHGAIRGKTVYLSHDCNTARQSICHMTATPIPCVDCNTKTLFRLQHQYLVFVVAASYKAVMQ